ncbi:protein tyrosine phosphatase family protein [Methylophaga lonarensis]|uniref:protein tyrosine phosphatase family protein n=1 Tax=Methylophaga lonarensis TaxID=999151 RepID=UPI003D2E8A2A
MDFQRIINVKQVNEHIHSSGQPVIEDFQLIADAGFETVINLLPATHPEALKNEAAIVSELGMHYLHIEVPFDQPQRAHWNQFNQLMEQRAGTKVWVHCLLNYRASAFLFLYLHHVQGLSELQARKQVFTDWTADSVWSNVMCNRFPEDSA